MEMDRDLYVLFNMKSLNKIDKVVDIDLHMAANVYA